MGLVKLLSNWKLLAVVTPTLILALVSGGWYLHSKGYQSGYEKAELVCAEQREAGKDEVLSELLRLQKEAARQREEMLTLNRSINEEVRKEEENVTERIETIVERQPIFIDPESCKRDAGIIELWNNLATAAGPASGSDLGSPSSDIPE